MAQILVSHPAQWYRIAGSAYCRQADFHPEGCRCAIRTLTQTAYRVRQRDLRGFAEIDQGCFEASAVSAAGRPDKLYPVEIKARYMPNCA